MVRQSDDIAFLQRPERRVLHGLMGVFINDFKNLLDVPPRSLISLPASQYLGGGVHKGHDAVSIRRNHSPADAAECYCEPPTLRTSFNFGISSQKLFLVRVLQCFPY